MADFVRTLRYNAPMWRIFRDHRRWAARPTRAWLCLVVLLAYVSTLAGQATASERAGWLDSVRDLLPIGAPLPEPDELQAAADLIKALPVKPPALVLAAAVTAQGHWTFVNQAGQRFTAASPSEMARVYPSLAPDIATRPAPVIIYVTRSSVFRHGEHLAQLPSGARLRLLIDGRHYLLHKIGSASAATWFAEVRTNVLVRTKDVTVFRETAWQLARRLERRVMRVVALQPAAPDTFRPRAQHKAGDGQQAVDPINPGKLLSALPTLRRQTAVFTGRLQGHDRLVYRTPSGAEQVLRLAPLRAVAARNDTNLVFVNAAAPRQPGARNWLWLRVEVDGLVAALSGDTLGDFLNRLSGGTGRLFAEARPREVGETAGRVALEVVPIRAGALEKQPGLISSVLAELVSEVAGSVLPHAVDADLVSMQRQRELDRRWLPGVPSFVQYGVVLACVFGLFALPVALRWWRRIWPNEVRGDYAGQAGYEAARWIRWLLFVVLFLPIAGAPAMAWGVIRGLIWLLRGGSRADRADGKADAGAATR